MPARAPGEVLQGAMVIEVRSLLHHLEGPLQTGEQPLPRGACSHRRKKTLNHFHASFEGETGSSSQLGRQQSLYLKQTRNSGKKTAIAPGALMQAGGKGPAGAETITAGC